MRDKIHSFQSPWFSDIQKTLFFKLIQFITKYSEMVITCVFFEDTKRLLRTLHIGEEEIIYILPRLNHFVRSDITLCITCFHSRPIRDRKSVVTYFFSESCEFVCENFIIHNKSKIFLDYTESFARAVDIGIDDSWIHIIHTKTFLKKIPHKCEGFFRRY